MITIIDLKRLGRSLRIREERFGENHPDVASSLQGLATPYYATGRYDKAEPLYKRSLRIREEQLGENHPHVARSLEGLANLYRAIGCYDEAELLYLRAIDISLSKLPPEHPDTQTRWNDFREMVNAAFEAGQADQLSGNSRTQEILKEISNGG